MIKTPRALTTLTSPWTPSLCALAIALAGCSTAPAQAAKHAAAPSTNAKSSARAATPTGSASKSADSSNIVSDEAPDVVVYGRRADVVEFAQTMASANRLDSDWVINQLAQARYQPSVAKLVMPPPAGAAKNWDAYRARFVEPQRIREGVRWWSDNEAALNRAEAQYGVPASIIASIVGVETFYGRVTGRYKVIDALATLSFDFPQGRSDRTAFYRDELTAFLRWCSEEHRNPQQVLGSYAGAIGLPQFMPSSILKYAVDFDGDGHIDLNTHGADVVGSVAHYLSEHGWQRGVPTDFPALAPADVREKALLLAPDIEPTFTAAQMRQHGATLDAAIADNTGPYALVELQNGDKAPVYFAGTQNFWVITRYNWSAYYAKAVIDLAKALDGMHSARMRNNAPADPQER